MNTLMSQQSKDNHYVPKLYLKQWVRDGEIQTYRLLVPNDRMPLWRGYSIKGIAYHQHLYTYLAGQEETDEFERWLCQEFEDPAEEAIRRVVQEQRMSPEHWKILTRFAMAQDVRTPARLREFLARQQSTLPELMNDTLQNSVKELEEAVRTGAKLLDIAEGADDANPFPMKIKVDRSPGGDGTLQTQIYVGRRLWIWSMRYLLTNTINRLPAYHWTVLHAPPGITWPTSDNPLIRLNFSSYEQYDFRGGWGVNNGDLLLPLSPKHLLHTCIGRRSWSRGTQLDFATAKMIQKIIIEHADRYIFAVDTADIHMIRPRKVCAHTYKLERDAWQSWHDEQSKAEADLAA